MIINANPEKKLDNILKQSIPTEVTFKIAKKMINDLKHDIQGLPSFDYGDTDNQHKYYLSRRQTENTVQYNSHTHQLVKNNRTNSFCLTKQDNEKQQKKKQVRFGSRNRMKREQPKQQYFRRKSCCCSKCGIDNQKINRLLYRGQARHNQMENAKYLKEKRDFKSNSICFSKIIAYKLNKNKPKVFKFRIRCHSFDTKIENILEQKQIKQQQQQRKEIHAKTQVRRTMFLNRQSTINEKLSLLPIKSLKPQKEVQLQVKTIPTQPSNTSSKILSKKKKIVNKTYNPINKLSLPQITTSYFTISANKSIDEQLKWGIRKETKNLKKLNQVFKSQSHSIINPYKNISELDYLCKIRRRLIN